MYTSSKQVSKTRVKNSGLGIWYLQGRTPISQEKAVVFSSISTRNSTGWDLWKFHISVTDLKESFITCCDAWGHSLNLSTKRHQGWSNRHFQKTERLERMRTVTPTMCILVVHLRLINCLFVYRLTPLLIMII